MLLWLKFKISFFFSEKNMKNRKENINWNVGICLSKLKISVLIERDKYERNMKNRKGIKLEWDYFFKIFIFFERNMKNLKGKE